MADYDHRNRSFDYTPAGGSGRSGGLLLLGVTLLVFFAATLFFGATGTTVAPDPSAVPAIDDASAPPVAPPATD